MIEHLLMYTCAKQCHKRWSSDKAIAKIKRCSFFCLTVYMCYLLPGCDGYILAMHASSACTGGQLASAPPMPRLYRPRKIVLPMMFVTSKITSIARSKFYVIMSPSR